MPDELTPRREWSELVSTSRRRGRVLLWRRRAATAVPTLALVIAALVPLAGGSNTPSKIDVVDPPSPTASPQAHSSQPLPSGKAPTGVATAQQTSQPRGGGARSPRAVEPRAAGPTTPAPTRTHSPAGGPAVVFASMRDGSQYDLYTTDVNGSGTRQLTDTPYDELFPEWSPDGRWIAYTRAFDDQSGLFVMRADGSNARRLTTNLCAGAAYRATCDDTELTWSPDGRSLILQRGYASVGCTASNDCPQLWVVAADGSSARSLGSGWSPHWSPDGRSILFVDFADPSGPVTCDSDSGLLCTGEISVMAPDGSGRRRLGHVGTEPAWSPDGRRVAFSGQPGGGGYELFVVPASGGEAEQVTDVGGSDENASPAWLPDGSGLVINGYRGADQACEPCSDTTVYDWDLFLVDLPSGDVRHVVRAPRRDIYPSVRLTSG
jgi:Tol biopolymer transport system component